MPFCGRGSIGDWSGSGPDRLARTTGVRFSLMLRRLWLWPWPWRNRRAPVGMSIDEMSSRGRGLLQRRGGAGSTATMAVTRGARTAALHRPDVPAASFDFNLLV